MSLATQITALATRVASEFNAVRSSFVPNARTVNGKALSSDIVLTASDVGAAGLTHNHTSSQITDLGPRIQVGTTAPVDTSKVWLDTTGL